MASQGTSHSNQDLKDMWEFARSARGIIWTGQEQRPGGWAVAKTFKELISLVKHLSHSVLLCFQSFFLFSFCVAHSG